MIRDILVSLSQGGDRDVASAFAISLASAYGAHVTGLAITYEVEVPPFYMGALPTDFIEAQVEENKASAKATSERFVAAAAAAGVSYEAVSLDATLGAGAASFARMSRLYDVTVVGQPDPDRPGPEEVIAETALMESGRAVLMVPYVQKKPFTAGRAIVAWDGGRASARALAESLTLLHRCSSVQVLSVRRPDAEPSDAAEVVRHLARHNLKAEVRELKISSGETVSNTILNEVSDSGADFVVMGGYGHSRLREMMLGGVTRDILNSMTVPVLMAH